MSDTESLRVVQGTCPACGKQMPLIPLHGPKGGPLRCFLCAGAWNAEHTRRRKWGRIIVKAMQLYQKEGGRSEDFTRMKLAAFMPGFLPEYPEDTIGTEVGDITSELLADTLQLVHPDRHPPERKALAQRVTQELLALKPFVFPAPKPKPAPEAPPRDGSVNVLRTTSQKPLRLDFPCELCASEAPMNYCTTCRAEWDRRQRAEQDRINAQQRRRRQEYARARRRTVFCVMCNEPLKTSRKDARYCSAACRQRHYRQQHQRHASP